MTSSVISAPASPAVAAMSTFLDGLFSSDGVRVVLVVVLFVVVLGFLWFCVQELVYGQAPPCPYSFSYTDPGTGKGGVLAGSYRDRVERERQRFADVGFEVSELRVDLDLARRAVLDGWSI